MGKYDVSSGVRNRASKTGSAGFITYLKLQKKSLIFFFSGFV